LLMGPAMAHRRARFCEAGSNQSTSPSGISK